MAGLVSKTDSPQRRKGRKEKQYITAETQSAQRKKITNSKDNYF
jgi:hypothetical protein